MPKKPEQDKLWLPYTQMALEPPPLEAVATEGTRILLADGRDLIDGIASWWTACHGYNHPKIIEAIQSQATIMPHVMFGGLVHRPALDLANKLAVLAPGDLNHVFFSDSGSVAVEAALKMALQFWINQGIKTRNRFVCFKGGYHGDTIGAMGVSDGENGFHATFKPILAENILADLPIGAAARRDYASLLDRHSDDIAAVIIEPLVQGAGGMVFHDPDTLAAIVNEAQKRGILVIADEVFTGFGRTGKMFACNSANVVPDIMTLSKALTGGALGLGATLAGDRVFDAFLSDDLDAAFMHGPTYMANPMAMAAANASLDLFETEPRLDQVATISAALKEGLAPCKDIPGVVDTRVLGAIGVVELAEMPLERLYALRSAFITRGLWVRPFGKIVYLTPAFTIESGEFGDLFCLMEGIKDVLSANPA